MPIIDRIEAKIEKPIRWKRVAAYARVSSGKDYIYFIPAYQAGKLFKSAASFGTQ